MSVVIDGKALAASFRADIAAQVTRLGERYGKTPCLSVIIVGDNPASRSYVRGKIKACREAGIESRLIEFPDTISEEELLSSIARLNADADVDAVLVQLPLPSQIDSNRVIDAISPEKDVDGFHPTNVAALFLGRPCMAPCTPKGIIAMIDSTGSVIDGARATVVGRSNIVGKPVAKLLQDRGATVTVAHSHTRNLAAVCRDADILVVATGHAGLVTADMVKNGAVVIDVGINRTAEGKLVGDVDFAGVSPKAGFISPVPGGVGPMTITMLLANTLECFKNRNEKQNK
ncbi:MAG: bifunctional methylenetetrahydrofolate dehydrogenase/methenyltetrahydrofolate cyclohydrolase FolD [Bacteroidales bacterium]|nr:bifunctional methylenetetrahydrofolate dehydrogenase/methenyltetrahydrofolate cyclohydrolase FolD [Bacteroidales bacterium]